MKYFNKLFGKLFKEYYFYLKSGLTYDCSNSEDEKEVLYDIEFFMTDVKNNKIYTNGMPYKIDNEIDLMPYLYDLKNNELKLIESVSGGRNNRYKIYLDNFIDNPLIIRTKDENLKLDLEKLLRNK